jgi:menaquinone-dependent protoporphyrinogen oxidase
LDNKILVAYSTWYGSTIEVAQEIAKELVRRGEVVDTMCAKKVSDISEYKTVVLGSSVHMGRCKAEMLKFVKRFQVALNQKNTAFFITCLAMKDNTEENRKIAWSYLQPLRTLVKPGKEAFFAGKVDFSKMNFIEVFVMKNIIKAAEGDYRNWDAIREWAQQVG